MRMERWRGAVVLAMAALVWLITSGSACVEPARNFVPGEPRLPYEPAEAWAEGCVKGPTAAEAVLAAEEPEARFGTPVEALLGPDEGATAPLAADGEVEAPAQEEAEDATRAYLVERVTIMRQRDPREWSRVVDRFVEELQSMPSDEREAFKLALDERLKAMRAASPEGSNPAKDSDCYAMLKEHRDALQFILDAGSRRPPAETR